MHENTSSFMSNIRFCLLFGCLSARFVPLSRGQPHSPDLDHCVLIDFQPGGHLQFCNDAGSLSTPSIMWCLSLVSSPQWLSFSS